jgi:hypothetical protein
MTSFDHMKFNNMKIYKNEGLPVYSSVQELLLCIIL